MTGSHTQVRTRFAPSPTGFLHIGGARTALYAWAFARHHGGTFILRIEDTDVERSTPEAVQAILDGMRWLGLQPDEGPFYQMRRMDRYREVIAQMLQAGTAYRCWCSREELDAMRAAQEARGEKPRYDGRWRPEAGRTLPQPPSGVAPVIRFRNPRDGVVAWDDLVKGPIEIANAELDDLIIARSDGTPTYNFCVVVDDWDMRISHVIRGDDHVNNTPRQINILAALGATLPRYGHVPMIHGPDGQKLSKRHGAVSVMQYQADGYLPEAVINYLARLGWSHGDAEVFSREQFVAWFDGAHISRSPARFDFDKLRWLNNHHIKATEDAALAAEVAPRLRDHGIADPDASGVDLAAVCGLLKERCGTLEELAESAMMFFLAPHGISDALQAALSAPAVGALRDFVAAAESVPWNREALAGLIRQSVTAHGLKMPQFGLPARLLLFGRPQTPALEAVLSLLPREEAIRRLRAGLAPA
ncbi:MAG: glutamate--tRNA ligase [Betaproteobacteria bacterium]|nr:glutamate--tRNA ligase [Betaproteobacteria bacterium]